MKSYLRFNTAIASAACGIALSAGVLSICARADQWDKKTVLTVNQPIQVEETLLQPGKYVLKLIDSSSDRHIVQIFNGDQTVTAVEMEHTEDFMLASAQVNPKEIPSQRRRGEHGGTDTVTLR